LILNAIFLGVIFSTQRKAAAARNWPVARGTVTLSTLERRRSSSGSGSVSYPVVYYTYEAGGQRYESNRIAPGMEVGGTGSDKVVARYPAGSTVDVHYNPQNPAEAVLEVKTPATVLIMWLVLAVVNFMMCGMGAMFYFVL
ncbi:MAG: DUF3592 domain-containing protein, partial [Chloroflexota bacterium]